MHILIRMMLTATAVASLGGARITQIAPQGGLQLPGPSYRGVATVTLPNGWRITPAGHAAPLPGDMPLKMLLSPDKKFLLINTGGFHHHSLNVFDLAAGKITQSVDVVKDWAGMCIDPSTGTICLAGGGAPEEALLHGLTPAQMALAHSQIIRYRFANGAVTPQPPVTIPGLTDSDQWIAGLERGVGGELYAVNTNTDTVFKLVNGVVQISAKVGYRPYGVTLSPDGRTLAVSNWGGRSVSFLDAATLQPRFQPGTAINANVAGAIATGDHPNELVYGKDGRLFVANAGSNSISVIKGDRVIETLKTSLDPRDRVGSTPVALALSPDQKRLYVANADNNDVAVIDTTDPKYSRVIGFIPTAWYPSALVVSPDGRTLYVGTAKSSRPNVPALMNDGQTQPDGTGHMDYVGDVMKGAVWTVALPDERTLAHYTRQVKANVPIPHASMADARAIQKGAFSKIKHVLYIIRENRTYDQVLGDMKEGNGDPSLTLFGERVTPNAHEISRNYVLLDNLYVNGDVSEDGHQWCNAAYATDFTEKAWTTSYSNRGEPDADDRLTASSGGYLWDNCRRHHVTYRSYGEFAHFTSNPKTPPIFDGDKGLSGHASLAWGQIRGWERRDTERAGVFIREMRTAEATGQWPQFMVMHLAEDHTQGMEGGAYSPVAHVAANDLALGQIVDAVSHSRFWKSTAIFVIEDDAQDGPDHVDCHRTVGLVISPYVRRGRVDSTRYTTVSYVRTIELVLGLAPMTQYDTAATPLYNAFTLHPSLTAYNNLPARVDLEARNPKTGPEAVASSKLDFTGVDRADPGALNTILWHALKPGVPLPIPVRSAYLPE